MAWFNPVYRNFDSILAARTRENATMSPEEVQKTIFFVGDSTIYGIGATEQQTASLPARFENFLKKVDPEQKCVNLGFPGSPTDTHLKILADLPDNATVIYRGGYIDRIYHTDNSLKFRFLIGNRVFEIRTLKMLAMLFSGFISVKNIDESRRLIRRMPEIAREKKLKMYSLGYSIYAEEHNALSRYCLSHDHPEITLIDLRKIMIGSPYLNHQQILAPEFRNLSGSHPNDIGYQVEATFLFNWFCTQKLLGLNENNIVTEKPLQTFAPEFQRRYREKLQILKAITATDLNQRQKLQRLNLTASDLWMELRQIHLHREMAEYVEDYKKIERLNTHIFHSENVLFGYLMSACFAHIGAVTESPIVPDMEKIKLYTAIMRATVHPEHEQRKNIETLLQKAKLPFPELQITYLPELKFYPLEYCPRFLQESGLSATDMSTEKDWEHFFNIPYSYFAKDHIKACATP
jgi:hypothetical protein